MRVRTAEAGDAEAIAGLTQELGYEATAEDVVRRLDILKSRRANEVFVACDEDDTPVGWINVVVTSSLENDPRAELAGLVVTEAWRGRGVGKRLMARAEEWARESNLDVLRVRTNAKRLEAHHFYEQIGYELIKQQRVYEKRL